MNQITCILDACSIINLIHIDEDDFLIKKLKRIEYYLCQHVFKEVNANVFNKLDKLRKNNALKKEDIKNKKREIDRILSVFRRRQKTDTEIKHELGDNFFDEVKKLSGYPKLNGEFYSTALALYLSRCKILENDPENFVQTKLFFHTDDYPAKQEFASFYLYQQIGHIEDTADLLILLYRLDDNFTENQLDRSLSKLFSEYASEVKDLEIRLRELKSDLPINLVKNKEFNLNLNKLIKKLNQFDFQGITEIRRFLKIRKGKYRIVLKLLNHYESVFELATDSTNLLEKIITYRKLIKNIYQV